MIKQKITNIKVPTLSKEDKANIFKILDEDINMIIKVGKNRKQYFIRLPTSFCEGLNLSSNKVKITKQENKLIISEYVKQTKLQKTIDPICRLILNFMLYQKVWLNNNQLATEIGVSWNTIKLKMETLYKLNIVKRAKMDGNYVWKNNLNE